MVRVVEKKSDLSWFGSGLEKLRNRGLTPDLLQRPGSLARRGSETGVTKPGSDPGFITFKLLS